MATNIQAIINYIPNLAKGITIIIAALLLGDYITDRIKASRITPFAKTIGTLVELVIAYIGAVIALPLILPGVSTFLLTVTYVAVLATIVLVIGIGGGIALGLGAKDTIRQIAKKKQKEIEKLI